MRLQVTGDGESLCFYCRGKLTNQLEKSQKFHNYCFETYSNYVPPIYNGHELPEDHVTFLNDLEDMVRDLQPDLLVNNKLPINFRRYHRFTEPHLEISTNINGIYSITLEKIPFTKLPKSLAKVTTLIWLQIINSELTKFPGSICKLKQLRLLEIHNCSIDKIPKGFANLINLSDFRMTLADLISIPDSISKIRNLSKLVLHDNHALKFLPKSLNNMKKLREIVIYNTPMNVKYLRRKFPRLHIQELSEYQLHVLSEKEGSIEDNSEY